MQIVSRSTDLQEIETFFHAKYIRGEHLHRHPRSASYILKELPEYLAKLPLQLLTYL